MLLKIKNFCLNHKFIVAGLAIALVLGGVYFFRTAQNGKVETTYTLATVESGTLVKSVSGTGQVSASNQVDLKPKASGTVTYIGVKAGTSVEKGQLIASLDARSAYNSVRDAQAALESARLQLEKLQEGADGLTLLQAENAIKSAEESKANAETNLQKSYDDGFNTVTDAFLDLPAIMTGLEEAIHGYDLSGGNQWNIDYYTDAVKLYNSSVLAYRTKVEDSYLTARTKYDQNYANYRSLTRAASSEQIEALILETYETTKSIADSIKGLYNLIQLYKDTLTSKGHDVNALANSELTSLDSYTGRAASQQMSLLSIKNSIASYKQTIVQQERSIIEKKASLAKLQEPTDELDLRSQQMTITQKKNALYDAEMQYANYYVYAPFDGVIASVDAVVGDTASSGSAVATLVTDQKIATIELNEVDAALVAVGQKVSLTFDAIEDLELTGELVEVDTLGTVTQGVVSYNAKINFDAQDERIKSGMSVSATIMVASKTDVLMVSSSAVKNNDGQYYVEILDSFENSPSGVGVVAKSALREQTVEVGLSNDTTTEIISGLASGDQVVLKTNSGSTTKATSSQSGTSQSLLGGFGGGGPR